MRGRDLWEKITSADVPPQLQRQGDGSEVEFPRRVISTTAADSRTGRSIEFCDILAGLAVKHISPLTTRDDRQFIDQVIDAGLKHVTYNGIRADTVFPDRIAPRELNGPDVVDQMTAIIA